MPLTVTVTNRSATCPAHDVELLVAIPIGTGAGNLSWLLADQPGGNGSPVAGERVVGTLAPGTSATWTPELIGPQTAAAGLHDVVATASSWHRQSESVSDECPGHRDERENRNDQRTDLQGKIVVYRSDQ